MLLHTSATVFFIVCDVCRELASSCYALLYCWLRAVGCFEHWASHVVFNFSSVTDSYSCGLSLQLGFTEHNVMQSFGLRII